MKAIFATRHVKPWAVHDSVKIGLSRLGYTVEHKAIATITFEAILTADVIASVGWKPPEHFVRVYRESGQCETPFLCVSDGYIKRSVDMQPRYGSGYWALSLNGLNSYTTVPFHDAPPDRWNRLGIDLQPWQRDGTNILVAHQHRPDWLGNQRHEGFIKIMDRATETARPILVRFHPNHWRGRDFPGFNRYKFESSQARRHKPIECDLKDAFCLATYDSNAATNAIIAGVPAFTIGRTIAYPMTNKITNLEERKFLDRQSWVNWLAYQQWTKEEIASGEAFEYILRINDENTKSIT